MCYYFIKHLLSKDKCICPRCGYEAFAHGFRPFQDYYCTECHLWERKYDLS